MKTQLSSLQHKQTFLRIMIFTLVTVMIWVGITLFGTQRETGIKPELLVLAEPLNPNINTQVIERVEQKRYFSPEELADFPIYTFVVSKTGEESIVVVNAGDRTTGSTEPAGQVNSNPTEQPAAPGIPTGANPTPQTPEGAVQQVPTGTDAQSAPPGTETPNQEQPQQPNQFQERVQLDSPTGE
jgi:hypothetical protein